MGYRLYRCRPCRRTVNERTGTPVIHLQVPTDRALLVVLWRVRYTLSLRDLAEMFRMRGFTVTHETVRAWAEQFAPLLTARVRAKRRGIAGTTWHADGNLVDSRRSATRAMDTAKRFVAHARGGGPRPGAGDDDDDGRAGRLPAGHPRDAGTRCAAPHE